MLVLSRTLGQSILIGPDIEVVLLDLNVCLPGTEKRIYDSVRLSLREEDRMSKICLSLHGGYYPRCIRLKGNIEIALLETKGSGRARIGINSPRTVVIVRGEVKDGRYGDPKAGGNQSAPSDGANQRNVERRSETTNGQRRHHATNGDQNSFNSSDGEEGIDPDLQV
jgi:sRNA-binding carbon storage regulator CsrA